MQDYSRLQDCLLLKDVWHCYEDFVEKARRDLEERKMNKVKVSLNPTLLLQFYKSHVPGSIRVIEKESGERKRKRILRGMLKLLDVGDEEFIKLFRLCEKGVLWLSANQLIAMGAWSVAEIVLAITLYEGKDVQGGREGNEEMPDGGFPLFTSAVRKNLSRDVVVEVEELDEGWCGSSRSAGVEQMEETRPSANGGGSHKPFRDVDSGEHDLEGVVLVGSAGLAANAVKNKEADVSEHNEGASMNEPVLGVEGIRKSCRRGTEGVE